MRVNDPYQGESQLDSWRNPVFVSGFGKLSESSPRIDILSPVLSLKNRENDLVLDMHYSLIRPRTWLTSRCVKASLGILSKLDLNSEELVASLQDRVPTQDPARLLEEWHGDLKVLSELRGKLRISFSR